LACKCSSVMLLVLEEVTEVKSGSNFFFFLKFDVGNGRKIHLWTDWWHPSGVLLYEFGYRVIDDAHSWLDARLSSVIRNGEWFWGPAMSDSLVEIPSCPW
jgi:hypothetical protein